MLLLCFGVEKYLGSLNEVLPQFRGPSGILKQVLLRQLVVSQLVVLGFLVVLIGVEEVGRADRRDGLYFLYFLLAGLHVILHSENL